METKKQEVKFATSDIKQMIGNYTAEVVKRKWIEDFVDKSTGQVVSVDRYEKILDKGVLIGKEKASSLNFYLQSGDISEVVVSNQCRKGDFAINNHPYSFAVTISRRENFTEKNTKLLLMAESTDMATEIVKDFAELKYDGLFWIKEIKQVGSILLKDTLKKVDKSIEYLKDNIDMKNQLINTDEDNSEKKGKFYSIDVNVTRVETKDDETNEYPCGIYSFIVQTQNNIDTSLNAIQLYIDNIERNRNKDSQCSIILQLEKAVEVKFDEIIDEDFCMAYFTE